MKVLGLGTAAMDIVLSAETLPREDGFAFINNEKLLPGGSCANVLAALKNLGIDASLLACLGDDHYGRQFITDIRSRGIDTEYLKVKKGGTSLHTFITVAANGKRAIFAHLGDSLLSLAEEDISTKMLKGVDIFYTDMFPGKPALKLARLCRENNIKVVFNLQCSLSFMQLCGVSRGEIEEMISMSHLFLSCTEGLLELAEVEDYFQAGAKVFAVHQPEMGLVTTWGEKGARWLSEDEVKDFPAFRVDAIDTTGAGDAFNAGLIYSYFNSHKDKNEALEFASACAAMKCLEPGPRLSANKEEVKAFLQLNHRKNN